jgi:hypothetical protein
MTMDRNLIARVCHEANRAYCYAMGEIAHPPWNEAPMWQKQSAFAGVNLHLSGDYSPEASHISWMSQKLADGWQYGPVKDPDRKLHPCLVPYSNLPVAQQAKDHIFRAIVHAFREATNG